MLSKTITINRKLAQALFDSGASVNVIAKHFIPSANIVPLVQEAKLTGVGSKAIKPLGTCDIKLKINQKSCPVIKAYVIDNSICDLIICHTTMKEWGMCIDYLHDSIYINQDEIKKSDVLHAVICAFFEVKEDPNPVEKLLREMISHELKPEEKEQIMDLLRKHQDAFSLDGSLGRVQSDHCKVNIRPDCKPFKSVPYRVSIQERATMKVQIDELLEKGLIERGISEYTCPVLLIAKGHKDASGEKTVSRFCTDLRKIKSMVHQDHYQLPNLHETLDTLAGKQYFFTNDLKKGYWQLVLEPDSRKYLAFVTIFGSFRWCVLPFGFINSSAINQRELEALFQEELLKNILVFIDDLLGFANSSATIALSRE